MKTKHRLAKVAEAICDLQAWQKSAELRLRGLEHNQRPFSGAFRQKHDTQVLSNKGQE